MNHMDSYPHDDYSTYEDRSERARTVATRDVNTLRLRDLVPQPTRSHNRRAPVIINGEAVHETLRERLTRELRELEIAVTQLANQLAKRTEQLEHLKRFPDEDPGADGDTLQFEKNFPNSPDQRYSYVAHRVDGVYYLSGARSPQQLTWGELVDWMGLGVSEVYLLPAQTTRRRRKIIG